MPLNPNKRNSRYDEVFVIFIFNVFCFENYVYVVHYFHFRISVILIIAWRKENNSYEYFIR